MEDLEYDHGDDKFQHFKAGAKGSNKIKNCCAFIKTFLTIMFFLCLTHMVYAILDKNAYGRDKNGRVKETWTFVDSCYFGVVTMTTVGYGDLYPVSDTAKIISIFYAPFAVLALGAVLGKLASLVVETQANIVEAIQHEVGEMLDADDSDDEDEVKTVKGKKNPHLQRKSSYAAVAEGLQLHYMAGIFKNFFMIVLYLFGGAAIFCQTEPNFRFLDSFYMCMISLSTVGYGDITPRTQEGRGFMIFYLPVGIILLAQAATTITLLVSKAVHRTGGAKELELLLNAMDQEGDDVLTESEYIIANLVAMGKVDENEVELQRQRFCFYNNLDPDVDGVRLTLLKKYVTTQLTAVYKNKKANKYLAQRLGQDIFTIADSFDTHRFEELSGKIIGDLNRIENPTLREMPPAVNEADHIDMETGKIAL